MLRRSAFALFLALASALQACPGCKDALTESPNSQGMWRGFYYTIVLLLALVFSMIGLLVYKIVQEARRETPRA